MLRKSVEKLPLKQSIQDDITFEDNNWCFGVVAKIARDMAR